MDLSLYKALNGLAASSDSFEDVLRLFTDSAPYMFAALLGWLFFARGSMRTQAGRHGAIAAGLTALLALGIAHVIGDFWNRPRPYEAHPGIAHLFVAASPDPSFPSDHATAAFAIAVAIFLRSRRPGWLALGMATVLAVSRVVMGTHYPTDVLGGAAVGSIAALVLWHPSVRRPLHRLADALSDLYERIVTRALAGLRLARS